VSIASTSLLANPSLAVSYWLTVPNNTNYLTELGNNITLALTESNNLTSVASIGKTLLIPNIETRVFPYSRLPEPKLWQVLWEKSLVTPRLLAQCCGRTTCFRRQRFILPCEE
jgi:hypothetical protein